ncbi:universal stress protein [Streptomyces sp. bgisy034]|uniref:universal stress protein n=1 Tax=Streptomyces sp. bgisy034 TaxID=3413774 RepID=UPI003EBA989A
MAVLRTVAEDAELLVLGLRGEGSHPRIPVGSTADALVRAGERPVLLVPGALAGEGSPDRCDGVALGLDARGPAGGTVTLAFETARLRGARPHAVPARRLPVRAAERPFPSSERIARSGRTTRCSICRTRCGRGAARIRRSMPWRTPSCSPRRWRSPTPPGTAVSWWSADGTAAGDVRPRGRGPSAHAAHSGHGPR